MNDIAKQLRTNADFVLGGTGMPPGAAIAGALQMGADEIDRLTRELDEAKVANERILRQGFAAVDEAEAEYRTLKAASEEHIKFLMGQFAELEARLAWHKVSDGGMQAGQHYAWVWGGSVRGEGYAGFYDGTNIFPADASYLGPLPAAPNEVWK